MAILMIVLMFATAIGVAHVLVRVSDKLVSVLLAKVVEEESLCGAWRNYIRLAVYVVGVVGGVEVYRLERVASNFNFGVSDVAIELYRVASGSAVAVIWLLLPVFLASLVIMELRRTFGRRDEKEEGETSAE